MFIGSLLLQYKIVGANKQDRRLELNVVLMNNLQVGRLQATPCLVKSSLAKNLNNTNSQNDFIFNRG